jgi:hypothetical protein
MWEERAKASIHSFHPGQSSRRLGWAGRLGKANSPHSTSALEGEL